MPRLQTILVADDNSDIREMVAATLVEAGYAVLSVVNGYEAVGVLADIWVNLLITDVTMPGLDGFELARQAKVMRPQIQVIYLSGYPADDAKNAGPSNGTFLQKPMRMSDLLGEVSRLLN